MTEIFQLPLLDRQLVAKETMAFRFDIQKTPLSFLPGQYCVFTLADPAQADAKGDSRVFSIASSPHHRDYILVATRLRPTAFKKNLQKLMIGSCISVAPPSGKFVLPPDESVPVVLIAGGIGITPFRSMIEWTAHTKSTRPIWLLYTNKTLATTAFLPDLERWVHDNTNIHFIPTLTDEQPSNWPYVSGKIDGTFLRRHIPDPMVPIYYLAGPPGLVAALRSVLLEAKVPEEKIKQELFAGYSHTPSTN